MISKSIYIRLDWDCTGESLTAAGDRAIRQIKECISEARFQHEVEEAEKVLREATATVKRARTGAWQKPPDFKRPPRKLRNTRRNR